MMHADIRRIFGAAVSTGALALAGCASATDYQRAPGSGMMGGGSGTGWMGGYGGPGTLLLLVVIAGLVVWIFARRRNKR